MASIIQRFFPFSTRTTTLQAITYLLFISLFSISFLVFLNSSISFVVTDLLNLHKNVGDKVGTLGFADELVALVACPFWGLVSDRLGVRWVCVLGYTIVGISLMAMVNVTSYRQLLIVRMLFSIGGAATATMVTAVLPSMTGFHAKSPPTPIIRIRAPTLEVNESDTSSSSDTNRHSVAFSTESGSTITPTSYARSHSAASIRRHTNNISTISTGPRASSPPKLAGIVGLFTGCGALLALSIFLPLPARFNHLSGVTPALALKYAFYTVGTIALLVALFVLIGLDGLQGEESKGWRLLFGNSGKLKDQIGYTPLSPDDTAGDVPADPEAPTPYHQLLLSAAKLGFTDNRITLAYLGGFVARASSVAISLFIPLSINVYFLNHAIGSGSCEGDPSSPDYRKNCRGAYILASMVTGISQLVALLCAPIFGYLSDRYRKFEAPLIIATLCGITGYIGFANLRSPELSNKGGRGGGPLVLLWVSLIGISQIGAIVCSLGLLGRGVQGDEDMASKQELEEEYQSRVADAYHDDETTGEDRTPMTEDTVVPVLSETSRKRAGLQRDGENRAHLKGSIAGIYSFTGGAAILLLTKLGGKLFDTLSYGAPFYMMAIFNAILGGVTIGSVVWREWKRRRNGGIALG